jgi:hypothetical protein
MLLTKKDSTEKLFKNILNASYREQQLPFVCKLADVMPLTKTDFSELFPLEISRRVSDYIKPDLEKIVDPNQFGTISGSSTVSINR